MDNTNQPTTTNEDIDNAVQLGQDLADKQQQEMEESQKQWEENAEKQADEFIKSITSDLEEQQQTVGVPSSDPSIFTDPSNFGTTTMISAIALILVSLPMLILWYNVQKKWKPAKVMFFLQLSSIIFFSLLLKPVVGLIFLGVLVLFYITKRKSLKEDPTVKKKDIFEPHKHIKNSVPGIVLGFDSNGLIVKPSKKDGHVIVSGGSGLGKSQCVSIPTLLSWDGSALVIDIKRELYAYTHQVRRTKGKVYVFDPEQQGHGYNPIALCNTVDSCQFLSRSLIPLPEGTNDPFWIENAQAVLASAVFEGNKENKTLPEIAERILVTEPAKLVEELTNSKYREAKLLASPLIGTPDRTMGGIFTQLKGKLISIATDENLRLALSHSDFSPESLEEVSTIYFRISENQISQYKALFNLMITQFTRYFSARGEGKQPPILMLLDELARFEKIPDYGESLATLRSRNIHILSAVQSVGQLDLYYGKDMKRSIMNNKQYKLVLGITDAEDQELFSKMSGKAKMKQVSKSVGLGTASVSNYEQWEERFQGSKFGQLSDSAILFEPGKESHEIKKVFWFQIPEFVALQKSVGGPVKFIPDDKMEDYAKIEPITRNIKAKGITSTIELIKEKVEENELALELSNNSPEDNPDDDINDDSEGNNDDQAEHKLLEDWDIIK